MKILVLADVPPAVVGGAEVQALRLAQHWASAGHDVLVAGPNNVEQMEGHLHVRRIPTLRATRLLRGVTYLLGALWLLWEQRRSCDVIYCRFVREQAFVAALAKRLFGMDAPLVACTACVEDASDSASAAALQRSAAGRFMLRTIRNGATCVNAISRVIAQELLRVGFVPERITHIPNGTLVPAAADLHRATNPERFRFLFVGRLVPQKGIDVLLHALSGLPEAEPGGRQIVLDLVGDGTQRESLRSLALQLGVASRVCFHGAIPNGGVPEYLLAADVFVLPSRFEGMPGVLLEACAHGLPVIATRVSGSEEILEHGGGWLVPPEDVAALRGALLAAIACSSEELARRGAEARAAIVARYDMDRVAADYLELFGRLCANPR